MIGLDCLANMGEPRINLPSHRSTLFVATTSCGGAFRVMFREMFGPWRISESVFVDQRSRYLHRSASSSECYCFVTHACAISCKISCCALHGNAGSISGLRESIRGLRASLERRRRRRAVIPCRRRRNALGEKGEGTKTTTMIMTPMTRMMSQSRD